MRARPPGESAAGLRGSAGHREVQLIWRGQDQPTLPATIHPTVHAAGAPPVQRSCSGPARGGAVPAGAAGRGGLCAGPCGVWAAVPRVMSRSQVAGGQRPQNGGASAPATQPCPPAAGTPSSTAWKRVGSSAAQLGTGATQAAPGPPWHLRGRVTGAGPRAGRSLGLGVMRERLTACRCGQSPGPPQYKRTLEPSGLLCQRQRGPCSRRGRRSEKAVSGQQSHQDGAPQMPRAAPWASHGPRVTPDALGAVPT